MINSKSRSRNSLNNIFIGILCQIVVVLFTFIGRTIFIKTIGNDYLGLNSLYSNILSVLSLAELGIGNVMIYSLYKPIYENDTQKIYSLLQYYKKIYRNISLIILALGLLLIPFLSFIIDINIDNYNINIYFLLFLFNSVSSYFVIYKTTLINADQKIFVIKIVNTTFVILKEILQIFILYYFKSYFLYLIIQLLCTITSNVILTMIANKMYPFIKKKIDQILIDRESLFNNIKSVFIYKLGTILMNNTDNILISILVGTVYVGYYSNYNLIITTITTFISIFIQAIMSSIGNLNNEKNIKKSYDFFNLLLYFFHLLTAFCSISLLLVINDFIYLWLGEKQLLSYTIIFAIIINFYIQNIINPVWIYRETLGLFSKIKYLMISAAIINLIFSIVLGLKFGLSGIIISTAIARILTTVWFEPIVIYRDLFNKSVINYWKKQLKYFIITIFDFIIVVYMCTNFQITFLNIIIKIMICFIVVFTSFTIINLKTQELVLFKRYIKIFINFIKYRIYRKK